MIGPPTFGWPVKLALFLCEKYSSNWAFTGSFAMYCHADALGQDCRFPDDLDIIIDGEIDGVSNVGNLAGDLTTRFGGTQVSGMGLRSTKACVEKCSIRENATSVKIDIAASSSKYGSTSNTDTKPYCNQAVGWKIVTVGKLIECKQAAIALPRGTQVDKHRADLATLQNFRQLGAP